MRRRRGGLTESFGGWSIDLEDFRVVRITASPTYQDANGAYISRCTAPTANAVPKKGQAGQVADDEDEI